MTKGLAVNGLLTREMESVGREFADILRKIPPRAEPYLPPEWLQVEMIERYKVLLLAGIEPGDRVLEVGCGAHAIATVPIALMVGEKGHVTAVEKERWQYFDQVVSSVGLKHRVSLLGCNAEELPIPFESFDVAVIVHGIRSMRNEETIVGILSEMLRVAPRIFAAESLPLARTEAQAAHLEMYNLRQEIFEAVLGEKDDIHYFNFDTLRRVIEGAGCRVTQSRILDVNLPHYLAFIPREYVEKILDPKKRRDLLARWDLANKKMIERGEEQPPVAIFSAERA